MNILEDLPALAVESVKKTVFDENRIPCKSSQKSIPQAPKTVGKVLEMQCCRETFLKLSIDYFKSLNKN
jgi:hypothetical protein